MSVYLSVICVFSVFRIVNETSTEASLAPGIDQLYSTNSWQGVHKVHKFVQLVMEGYLVSYGINI